MSTILDAIPEALELVQANLLSGGIDAQNGRRGLPADEVLRVLVLKQMRGFTFEQLAFHLADSRSYRAFVRLGEFDKTPSASALHENVQKLRAGTLERINPATCQDILELSVCNCNRRRIMEGQSVEPWRSTQLAEVARGF